MREAFLNKVAAPIADKMFEMQHDPMGIAEKVIRSRRHGRGTMIGIRIIGWVPFTCVFET
jgi:hypothetical protein